MSVCSSGGSEQIPGTSDDVILTAAVLEALAAKYAFGWLAAPFIGAAASTIQLHLPTFCAVDPPADPGITGADLLGLVTLGPGPLTQGAADKVVQLLERYAWYSFCECSAVATPAPPTPPSQPSGTPAIDPNQQVGLPTTQPCVDITQSSTTQNVGAGRFVNVYPFNYFDGTSYGAVAPLTSFAFLHTPVQTTGSGSHIVVKIEQQDDNNVVVQTDTKNINTGTTGSIYVQRNALATNVAWSYTVAGGTGSVTVNDLEYSAYCSGQIPNSTVSPCCPPDPILTTKLDALLQLVTLIQRQAAPFAYIAGPAHSGLTGTGAIGVDSLLGVLLNVSFPSRAGEEAGTPVTIFDCGWINFATPDGYTERFFVASDSQVVIPKLSGIYTNIGYTFLPGVTVTITELAREP